jgi:uncharacterized protein (TIGR00255 family)
MNSMTGYGRGGHSANGIRCAVECSSLNRKGAEVSIQIPREFAALELPIRNAVLKRIARGRVVVVANIALDDKAAAGIDHRRAKSAADQLRRLQRALDLSGDISIDTLLAIPGVILPPQPETNAVWTAIQPALDAALDAMLQMRRKEGLHLQKELRKHLVRLRASVRKIRRHAAAVPSKYRQQLVARLAASNLQLPLDDPRLLTEIAVFAERCDVTEELNRLDSHFTQLDEKLEGAAPAGRAVEFLTQEIFRELNTLGTKAAESAISRLVVESKVELDKLREQILNVE